MNVARMHQATAQMAVDRHREELDRMTRAQIIEAERIVAEEIDQLHDYHLALCAQIERRRDQD